MNLRQIEALVWLARLGSFRATANQLHATQPAITLRIQELERELGAKLFDRTRRAVSLTAEGRDCLALAEQILNVSAELRLKAGGKSVRGRVAVGVSEVIAQTWLPDLFSAMDRQYRDVQMDVIIDTTPALLDALESGQLDVVLAGTPHLATTHVVLDLGKVPFVWLGRGMLRGKRAPYHPRDFENERIITWPKVSAIYQSVEEWFTGSGVNPSRRITCNTAATMADLAAAGLGVTILPPVVVKPKLDAGLLRILPTQPAFPALGYWAIYVAKRRGSLGRIVAETAQNASTFRA